MALVPQDPIIFGADAWENIRYGLSAVNDDDVRSAADAAHATEFLEQLPQGFNTFLGERGIRLSGGQRQKLNLALTMLDDPEVLLLDEPYQGFDHGTYVNLWDQIAAWTDEGRAVIVITHLLAEASRVDRVVEVANGVIEEVLA